MPASLTRRFDKATRDANRNRYLVIETDLGVWAVVRIGHRGGVGFVLAARSEPRALALADQLNDMFEEGMIY